jgi:hypothetical protein
MERPDSCYPETIVNRVRVGHAAKALLELLNGNLDSLETRRLQQLASCMQQLLSLAAGRSIYGGLIFRLSESQERQFLKAVKQINAVLANYRTVPVLCGDKDRDKRFYFNWGFGHRRITRRIAVREMDAVQKLIDIADNGQFSALTVCVACEKWFFRKFSHQRFCSESCRMGNYRQSDSWKAYKRDKAREYYWLHKLGKVKEREACLRARKRG